VVIGIGGGRLDHQLANYTVLSSDRFHTALVEGLVGSARLTVVRGAVQLAGALGETISLIPIRGLAEGVTTDGLEYQLNDEPLYAGSARGVSNRFVAERATVSVTRGVVLAVQPFALRERSGR
jgi:thiamine pyrophosphokinase